MLKKGAFVKCQTHGRQRFSTILISFLEIRSRITLNQHTFNSINAKNSLILILWAYNNRKKHVCCSEETSNSKSERCFSRHFSFIQIYRVIAARPIYFADEANNSLLTQYGWDTPKKYSYGMWVSYPNHLFYTIYRLGFIGQEGTSLAIAQLLNSVSKRQSMHGTRPLMALRNDAVDL